MAVIVSSTPSMAMSRRASSAKYGPGSGCATPLLTTSARACEPATASELAGPPQGAGTAVGIHEQVVDRLGPHGGQPPHPYRPMFPQPPGRPRPARPIIAPLLKLGGRAMEHLDRRDAVDEVGVVAVVPTKVFAPQP